MHSQLNLARSRRTEQGFALPTALLCGVVMILAASALLLRAQDDNSTAAIQRATDSSLDVTEGGLTRIQAFLDANRTAATYSLSQWTTTIGTQLVGQTVNACGTTTSTSSQTLANFAALATTWQNLDASNPSKGQYRLVNYTYVPNNSAQPNSVPGQGILDVEGRLNDSQSIHRLRVTIPVNPADTLGVPTPGLWLSQGDIGNNNTIQGNVVLNDCSVQLASVSVTGTDPNTGQPYRAAYTNMQFPPLPPKPSPSLNSLPAKINNNVTLPRSSDVSVTKQVQGQSVQVYEYALNDLDIASSKQLTITAGARVTFYLDGSINRKGGTGNVQHDCTTTTARCSPIDFQVFGYGSTTEAICLNGSSFIDMFILAPNYTTGIAGAAGGQGGVRGAVWSRSWSTASGCGSNTTNVVLSQTADWYSLGLSPIIPIPKLAPPSSWERREVPSSP